MNFEIKIYRSPAKDKQVIVIGRAHVEMEGIERILPAADSSLYQTLQKCFEHGPNDGLPDSALLAAVRKNISEAMREGKPQLVRVAEILAVGPRTLQRRLKRYGIDFKELVDETRCQLAMTHLRDRKNTLTEIALLLGYSEVSAFNRAFKRWTGATPLNYRRVSNGRPRRNKTSMSL